MKKKIVEYDYVRAVAVLLVILGHCRGYGFYTDYGGLGYLGIDAFQSKASAVLGLITSTLYSFHMPLFVALSGCLWAVTLRNKGLSTFKSLVTNKSERLLLPFLFTFLFWEAPLKYIAGWWQGSNIDILYQIIVGNILMYGNSNSHLWFLQALFIIFILAYFIERGELRRNPIKFMCVIILLSFVGRYAESHHYRLLNIQTSLIYLSWFYVGFYFECYREKINSFVKTHVKWKVLIAATLFYPMIVYLNGKLPGASRYLSYYPIAIWGMFVTYCLCYKALQITPPHCLTFVNKISSYSYGLYLFSCPPNYIIIKAVAYFDISCYFASDAFTVGIYLFRFLFTTAVAWGITVAVRKYTKLKI